MYWGVTIDLVYKSLGATVMISASQNRETREPTGYTGQSARFWYTNMVCISVNTFVSTLSSFRQW